MKTTHLIFLLITASLMLLFGTLYGRDRKNGTKALFFKGTTTFMAVLLAGYQCLLHPGYVSTLFFLGTLACMIADILLELYFYAGVFSFALAHLFFLLGFLDGFQMSGAILLMVIGLYIIMLLRFKKYFPVMGKLTVPGLIYAIFLCTTCAVAINGFLLYPTVSRLLIAIGGISFFISDNILGGCIISKQRSSLSNIVILSSYFLAVYLYAASLYF